jgi:hypothetical protein
MIKHKRDIIDFAGRLIFITLFFILISAFSGIPSKQDKYTVQYESVIDLCSANTNAVVLNPIIIPSHQIYWVQVADKVHIRLSAESHKIFTDNKKVNQLFIFLQKNQLHIKPNLAAKFYYHFFSPVAEDLPILS